MTEYPIELNKEAMAAIEEIKEPNESLGSVAQRAFQLLYYFTKQHDAGFTQVFLRNPEKKLVRKLETKIERS